MTLEEYEQQALELDCGRQPGELLEDQVHVGADVGDGGAGFKRIPAGAVHRGGRVRGMDVGLHEDLL